MAIVHFTYKTYSYGSIMAKQSSFTGTSACFETIASLVKKSQMESRRYFGSEPNVINTSYTMQQVDRLFQNNDSWAILFAQF